MAVVTFSPTGFKIRYPEFSSLANAQLSACFDDASLYCDNTDASRVTNVTQRQSLLWMLTAHIAALSGLIDCGDGVRPVGRVSSAEEGSVSSELDYMSLTPGSGPWYQQTQYGAAYWQATAQYRGFRYRFRATLPW